MTHRHAIKTATTRPFSGCVIRTTETGRLTGQINDAAHGGTCERQVCACGATRDVNVNGRHVERGPWLAP